MNAIDKNIHADQRNGQCPANSRNSRWVFAYEDIPETVRERAKHLMLDAIGIAYASRGYHFAQATMDALTRWAPALRRSSAAAARSRRATPRS